MRVELPREGLDLTDRSLVEVSRETTVQLVPEVFGAGEWNGPRDVRLDSVYRFVEGAVDRLLKCDSRDPESVSAEERQDMVAAVIGTAILSDPRIKIPDVTPGILEVLTETTAEFLASAGLIQVWESGEERDIYRRNQESREE